MKVKLDENMPRSASQVLVAAGHDADTVVEEKLAGATDPQVVAAAAATGRLLITLDRGLGDIRTYPPGSHAGILVLRPADQSVPTVVAALAEVVTGHDLTTLTGTIAIAACCVSAVPVATEPRSFRAMRSGIYEPSWCTRPVGDPGFALVRGSDTSSARSSPRQRDVTPHRATSTRRRAAGQTA